MTPDEPEPPQDGAPDPESGEQEKETESSASSSPSTGRREPPPPKPLPLEDDDEVANPDTPVPSMDEMQAALTWAFEGEDEVTPDLVERFATHALAVLEANRTMNLTAVLDPKEVAAKHYVDSWRVTRLVPLMAKKVLDMGSGAGFPGLPLALAEPNLIMTLVDSTKKKADFLESSIEKVGIKNASAVWNRVEDHLTTARVDVVVVRAVSSVRENVRVLRKVRHSLKDLVMLKGPSWSREVRAAEREAERLGFKLDTVWEHDLPGELGGRAILVYRAPGGAGL